jgi:hypothetical protein
MTTKKVLLMVGLLAAIGIAYWAFNGTPVDDGEEGAIGAANRYRAEQISDSDVKLEDAEVIALLQDDVFLNLIQDEDFQALMAREDFASALAKHGVEAAYGRMTPSAALSHQDVAMLAARDDVTSFLRGADVQAAFEKSWKLAGEGNTKDGRVGKSSNVWGKSNVEALEKQLVSIITEKNAKFEAGDVTGSGKSPKGQLQAQDVAQLLARPAVMEVMGRQDLRQEMLSKSYVELAKSWKLAGEGNTKDGRKGHSSNIWGARQDVLLGKLPNVATLDKSWKLAGEGNTKDGRVGRSSNLWGAHADVLMKQNVSEALMAREAVAFLARPDVQSSLAKLNTQQAFSKQNIQATLGKFNVSQAP